MNDNEWATKYSPQSISELVANSKAITDIVNWLGAYNKMKHLSLNPNTNKNSKKNNSCIVVTGSHGHGKTCSVLAILNSLEYNVHNLNVSQITKGLTNNENFISKMMLNSNILSMMTDEVKNPDVILIDQLEVLTSPAEKAFILNLQKMNAINWYFPIILISNNHHSKFLTQVKKFSLEIKFFPPYDSDMSKILTKIAYNEGIRFEGGMVLGELVYYSQKDIRQAIFMLYDIQKIHSKVITLEIVQKYCKMTNARDVDVNLFKAATKLLTEKNDVNNCIKSYETEKVLLPLMIQQNYIKHIIGNFDDVAYQHTLVKSISDSLSTGDITENYIYGEQNWNILDVHGIFSCVNPSYHLNERKGNGVKIELDFAKDLNKTTIKSINKKNIINTDVFLKNMNINDYLYLHKILRKLINKDKISECVELLSGYDVQIEYIESLLKIDKIGEKISLTPKQKKEFMSHIERYRKK